MDLNRRDGDFIVRPIAKWVSPYAPLRRRRIGPFALRRKLWNQHGMTPIAHTIFLEHVEDAQA